jgi:chitinase
MSQVVPILHDGGAKVLLSVGGWTGSDCFSTVVKDAVSSQAFTKGLINIVKRHDLDGVDLDWEYPGKQNSACNAVDTGHDAANFLAYLKDLRAGLYETFGQGKLITLALGLKPFDGSNGCVSGFAEVVDYGNLMQYDINGPGSETTGPVAPLNFEPGKGAQHSFVKAIEDWTGAGWPASQLVAGVGFFGKALTAAVDMSLDPTNQYQPHVKRIWTASHQGEAHSGIWQWKDLRGQGVLRTPTMAAAPWIRNWDAVTQTPWLFNPTSRTFISYDDPESVARKVEVARAKGLAGMMAWTIDQDSDGELVTALRSF